MVEILLVSQASLVGGDYVDSLSKMMSFRSSGRFFNGSSRRNHIVVGVGDFDIEANINGFRESEMFMWNIIILCQIYMGLFKIVH